jgi:hypothetical protein
LGRTYGCEWLSWFRLLQYCVEETLDRMRFVCQRRESNNLPNFEYSKLLENVLESFDGLRTNGRDLRSIDVFPFMLRSSKHS